MESFNEWMDANGISPEDASEIFAKSPGTIRNWRSIGVPESQREWVAKRISEHDAAKGAGALDRLVIEVTDQQLRSYIDAAAEDGLYLKDWAIQTLDEAASPESKSSAGSAKPIRSIPLAAEDGVQYRPKKDATA